MKVFKHLILLNRMKREVFLALALVLFVSMVSAASGASAEYSDKINSAFNCLDSRVSSASLSLEDAVFAALAKTPNSKINSTINQQKSASEFCWPNSGCTVKQTAQVALAKMKMGENVGNITKWLKSKAGVTKQLSWYLQISIDNNGPATCKVNYDGADHPVTIDDEMKLSGNAGSCLSVANSNYWLKISSACLDKTFNIDCDSSFKTNLLYEKEKGGTIFVSSQTHGASAGSWTVEEISAKCFMSGDTCDYEGSLWAATALYANNENIDEFAPYLRALASENEKYFPSAFLVAIFEGGDEHYSNIIESQKIRPEGAYWEMPLTPYNKYYDTALAMLAFGGADSAEIENSKTKDYLFLHQDETGCWNGGNIRDTAFIIYAAHWGRSSFSKCGDGIISGSEACDGTNLGGATCVSQQYESGNLSCIPAGQPNECTFEVGECVGDLQSECGDNQITGNEVCDCGSDGVCTLGELNGETCSSRGSSGSGLNCSADCRSYNPNACSGGGPPGGNGTTNGSNGGGGYNPNLVTDCELTNLFCAPSRSACIDAGGVFYSQSTHACADAFEYCCSVEVTDASCSSLGGTVCPYDQPCEGTPVESRDGQCCVAPFACSAPSSSCITDSDCFAGKVCRDGSCVTGTSGSECSVNADCGSSEECVGGYCQAKQGSSWWIWIIILLILIVLVVLGIVYRDKLRVWWFKMRGKMSSSKVPPRSPPPGMMMQRRPIPRFGPPQMQPRPQPRPAAPVRRPATANSKDNEEEETLRKLREMSK